MMIRPQTLPRDEEPHERQPQLAGVRHRTIVEQDFGGVRPADDLEQITELDRVN